MLTPRLNFSKLQPKVSLFRGSGTGRDTYVMHDSGGFVKASCADSLIRAGSQVRPPSTTRTRVSSIEGKTVIYRSNGTGRDNYIVTDSGGMTCSTARASDGFRLNLRNYERIKTPQEGATRDYFGWAQRALTGKELEGEFTKSKIIKDVTARLSTPKQRTNVRIKNLSKDFSSPTYREQALLSARGKKSIVFGESLVGSTVEFDIPEKKKDIVVESSRKFEKTLEINGEPVQRHRKTRSDMMISTLSGAFRTPKERELIKAYKGIL